MLRVIETFSGIGAQAKALTRLRNNNSDLDFEIVATCEWEIGAMYAYDLIHHGSQNLNKYDHYSKEELVSKLSKLNLSNNGKEPLGFNSLKRMSEIQLKAILHSIEQNKNLIDINTVHAIDLPEAELLTYSFPCQDLSISSFWWNNKSGIDPESGNRSSLLWQIGRIISEYDQYNLAKPRFLLMENVTAIQSSTHEHNFNLWLDLLRRHGYTINIPMQLNATNFGIPQNRNRTYMLSVLAGSQTDEVSNFLFDNNLARVFNRTPDISNFLRLDYSNNDYYTEAIESIPNDTPSRRKIHDGSTILAEGNNVNVGSVAKTITTKQDRFPTAGLINHQMNLPNEVHENPASYRNLTPRETFLLMGFDEQDFQKIKDNNIQIAKNRKFLSHSKLLKLTGNSIVVNVLESIFRQVHEINTLFFDNKPVEKPISKTEVLSKKAI